MAAPTETRNMALFCDFENIALGVKDAKYEKFDIALVLEKLLVKGSIVVKKAYCDWERYKGFKAPMHEAAFELIEIPHVRQSGKNSADIRMVVDALDLCYTKAHVDTFVLITGDSDFSPLVSKLRENNKLVIAVGVKASTSDLLIRNCDEFIYYDDLVRARQQRHATAEKKAARKPASARKGAEPAEDDKLRAALELVAETVAALAKERGGDERILPGMLKQAVKRREPGFDESFHGFSMFTKMLQEAEKRGLLKLARDDKTGPYVIAPTQAEG